ncbi:MULTISPECIES: PilW family protein [unclassified Psychrobacter]|uniref:PilW family protein n=1 Tax=unclassified Psychrobacter TaxID=196806 RepID=UPI0018F37C29|nr:MULTISPECIES: PilW family protein [unclassified Psychrobacter]
MRNINHSVLNSELGFTLIELMISLVLGLLISAAVMQVYLISTRTVTVQQSASEVQDSTIFAMQALEKNIRLANLGNDITNITSITPHGGIVLTGNNINNASYKNTGDFTISAGQSVVKGANSWTGISNTDKASDQLTIQYKNITNSVMYDCEGTEVAAGSSDWVVERYFIRETATNQTATVKELGLACDAGRVTDAGVVSGFGGAGEVLIPAVDQFKVLLGVRSDVTNVTYLPAQTYLTLTDKPDITTLKLGVIIRSNTPLLESTDSNEFTLLDAKNTLKTDTTRRKYYRRAYETTVLLRNARVMSVVASPISSS